MDDEKQADLRPEPKRTWLSKLPQPSQLFERIWPPLIFVIAIVLLASFVAQSSVDLNAVRMAAREGVFEAVATLEAEGRTLPAALGTAQPQPPNQPSKITTTGLTLRKANRLGQEDAPITIVEFADFQCPFCHRVFENVQKQLIQDYVSSNKVSFVYKHLPFLGPESTWAAQAAECAADQGKFWEYHDLLFTEQAGENVGVFQKDNLIKFAQELKLDVSRFAPCLRNDETLERVKADQAEAEQIGFGSTPTFLINGQLLIGAQPYKTFQTMIEQALSNVGR